MFKIAAKKKLLPVGTRVFCLNSSIGRRVKGTIVGYNLIIACDHSSNKDQYCRIPGNFRRCDKNGVSGICINSPDRPYIIRFDPTPDDTGYLKYPEGYLSAYETEAIKPVLPFENIFPNKNIEVMARQWPNDVLSQGETKVWSPWLPITQEEYEQNKADLSFEFCVRKVAPEDKIPMITLWRTYSTNEPAPGGYWPPLMTAVHFHLRDGSFHTGVTGLVKTEDKDGWERHISPVFVVGDKMSLRVYTLQQVQEWCLAL